MDWLTRFPLRLMLGGERRSLVLYNKIDPGDLTVCQPKGVRRERPFWRYDRITFYHLQDDGVIRITPD